jgi:hypothetical protein
MKVKNGIARSSSLERMPKKRIGSACRKATSKSPRTTPRMAKNIPTAESENATGKPISMNMTMPANISGGIMPKASMLRSAALAGFTGGACRSASQAASGHAARRRA